MRIAESVEAEDALWNDCADLLTRSDAKGSGESLHSSSYFRHYYVMAAVADYDEEQQSRQLERGFHSAGTYTEYPVMTRNDCSRVNRQRTRHARRINCSFLPALPPPLVPCILFARSRITDELDDRGASRFAMHSHRAQAISKLLLIAEGIDYNGFTCGHVNATFIALFMVYRTNNDLSICYHARGFIRYRCCYPRMY